MAVTFVPHKACRVGFGLQSAKGTAETQPSVVFPVNNGMERVWNMNHEFFQYADGVFSGETHYFSSGRWLNVKCRFPLVPGMLQYDPVLTWSEPHDDIGDIGDWMFARTALAGYHQGLWATIFVETGTGNGIAYPDCKVLSGEIDVSQRQLVYVDVDVCGIGAPVAWTPTAADGTTGWATDATTVTQNPYTFKDATVTLAGAAEASMRSLKLSFDNMVRDPGDGVVLGSLYPAYLPNGALAQWTGSFDRDFVDTVVNNAYVAGTEFALVLTLDAGTPAATFTFPRTIITENGVPNVPDSGIVTQDGVGFKCLGAANGSARAYTIAEVIA